MQRSSDGEADARGGLYSPFLARKTARTGLAALAAAALAVVVGHERFTVAGTSMAPTLAPGDRLLVRRWPRRLRAGRLIVVADPREPARLVVKRLADVRGVTVTVSGDNIAASTDSRVYGPLARALVRGVVVYRYAPPGRTGCLAAAPPLRTGEPPCS